MKFGNVLEVAKNREHGVVDLLVGMYFEVESRRLKNDVADILFMVGIGIHKLLLLQRKKMKTH